MSGRHGVVYDFSFKLRAKLANWPIHSWYLTVCGWFLLVLVFSCLCGFLFLCQLFDNEYLILQIVINLQSHWSFLPTACPTERLR